MILEPCNIELTKIHYYRKENAGFSGIEQRQNNFNKNVIIKKNVFGQRWVLEINESEGRNSKEKRGKVVVYVLVFCSIIVAVGFGIFLSFDKRIFRNPEKFENDIQNNTKIIANFTNENLNLIFQDNGKDTRMYNESEINDTSKEPRKTKFCATCTPHREICLKTRETEKPKCVPADDLADPTGCGGLCPLGTHYCQILDRNASVFQCSLLKTTLECENGTFSCGNMCVAMKSRCDGVMDCYDQSDELNCDCDLKTHFQCGNLTSCLDLSKKCDQNLDCWDKSDEVHCSKGLECRTNEFPCSDSSCIPKEKFCDGNLDCSDKSDEPKGCQIMDTE